MNTTEKVGLAAVIIAVVTLIVTVVLAVYYPAEIWINIPTPTPTLIATPTPIITPTSTPTTATATPSPSVTPTPPAEDGGSSDVSWQKSDMGFTFGEQACLVIGYGRNDGIMRVYSGDGIHAGCGGNIYEFSFLNNQWEKISFGEWKTQSGSTDDLCHIEGIVIGTARNDGVKRVYGSGLGVAEFYYTSDSWNGDDLGNEISSWVGGLALGAAHNDGEIRMYVAGWKGIHEISYNYGDWDAMEIDTGGQRVKKLLVTDGHNDLTFRLYAAIADHIYEYSYSGSTWRVVDCGTFDVYNFADICAGDGRNDGINRIYLAGDGKGIYELSYDGLGWQHITVSASVTVSHIVVANGRNDGVNRLYTGSSKGVGEYTYSGSWAKTANIETSCEVTGLAIGDGRNDGVNRVYVTCDDNQIYEYSAG